MSAPSITDKLHESAMYAAMLKVSAKAHPTPLLGFSEGWKAAVQHLAVLTEPADPRTADRLIMKIGTDGMREVTHAYGLRVVGQPDGSYHVFANDRSGQL